MKKYIKPLHLELELIAILDESLVDSTQISVVAAKHNVKLEYRDLPLEWQLSGKVFDTYQNWLCSMASIIASYGFEIVDEYQSKTTYSYYIQFTPVADLTDDISNRTLLFKEGTDILLDVKLRLSNHRSDANKTVSQRISKGYDSTRIFSGFVVDGVKHDSINTAIKDLQDICKDLQHGDYSRLLGQ